MKHKITRIYFHIFKNWTLVNGVLYPLTDKHKVVFAGNPVNYGDERKLAPFFQRHGNAVLFTPLPPSVLYEKILKQAFANIGMNQEILAKRILDVYRFVCECSTTEILISPRELEEMAILTLSRFKKNPKQDVNQIVNHFSYELVKQLVPPEKKAAFDKQFKPDNLVDLTLVQKQPTPEKESTFLITPSRQPLVELLNDLLDLRQLRHDPTITLNDTQKKGGLGGMIIQGAPGIGKSELVIAALVARGYEEQHDFKTPATSKNPFYRMPAGMSPSKKEELLIKAFNEGAVVMIDEMNSSPSMERLLNDLLMGKNPKRKEDVIEKPGFMVLATQNPVTMEGRRLASTALLRRCINIDLPEYSPDEIKTILLGKGVKLDEAESMMAAYEENRAFAIKNRLSPVPNFRNLMQTADNHLKAIAQAVPLKFNPLNHEPGQGVLAKLKPTTPKDAANAGQPIEGERFSVQRRFRIQVEDIRSSESSTQTKNPTNRNKL